MTFVGIDVGTTRIKALLYDVRSQQHTLSSMETPIIDTRIGDFRCADEVFGSVLDCIDLLLTPLAPGAQAEIEGIGVTSLSEEVVLIGSDGRSLAPMPTWYNSLGAEDALSNGIDPSYSWVKLRWAHQRITDEDSRHFGGHRISDVRLVTTLNGYITGRLTGGADFPVDASHASRSGFFNLATEQWDVPAFEATGWHRQTLPEVVPTGTVVSTITQEFARRWGIPSTTPIVLAGHDHFCGAFAVGIRASGQLYVSAGTSEAHCLIVPTIPPSPLPRCIGVGKFVDGDNFYLHRQLPSGRLYQHWRRLLDIDESVSQEQESLRVSAEPLGSHGLVIIPGFDTDARTSVFGLNGRCSPHTLLRALLEGLACAGLHIDRELADIADCDITTAIAAGIPCQSSIWQQLHSQLTLAPLFISTEQEAPALGAALLCRKSVLGIKPPPVELTAASTDDSKASDFESLFSRFENLLRHPEHAEQEG